jgi:hypothetical protein
MVPWSAVREAYEAGESGLHIDEIKDFPEILRDSEDYSIAEMCMAMEI